jgi:hypothetical protein
MPGLRLGAALVRALRAEASVRLLRAAASVRELRAKASVREPCGVASVRLARDVARASAVSVRAAPPGGARRGRRGHA